MMIPTYSSNSDMYENYHAPSKLMRFEGHVYQYKGTERKSDTSIHHYRCDLEKHNLKIHLHNGVPFYVEGIYKIAG